MKEDNKLERCCKEWVKITFREGEWPLPQKWMFRWRSRTDNSSDLLHVSLYFPHLCQYSPNLFFNKIIWYIEIMMYLIRLPKEFLSWHFELRHSLWRRVNARKSALETLHGGWFTLSIKLIKPNYLVILPTKAAPQLL